MPEGDVVLRTARRLTAALADGPLVRSELRWPTLAGTDLTGVRSLGTASYGKNLLTRFSDGRTLHTHLRMDGTWRVTATPPEGEGPRRSGADGVRRSTGGRPRDRRESSRYGSGPRRSQDAGSDVRAVLATATWTCTGHQLGMMHLLRTHDEARLLAPLGPDVLGEDFGAAEEASIAVAIHAQGAREIGAVLLDQGCSPASGRSTWPRRSSATGSPLARRRRRPRPRHDGGHGATSHAGLGRRPDRAEPARLDDDGLLRAIRRAVRALHDPAARRTRR
ncbi:DNA-formamidopyrimidine glycosylase family protein [Litorihabitans aurantiacus]|uniref:Formamidopyrimidine-DNA glycosylase catalytic domain-containing protein n=1 Tax=Litorihabitans aurantiacus TaxID=1930061 RepID=A0AA37XEG6_9MICO|nr:DNA-formamidopyrimidine glycosylase family protein [Litorihabitans aurantiacus]GMA31761.1 hypothetical protein GCM10025875_17530 [Litorihabitans aurantiacus]